MLGEMLEGLSMYEKSPALYLYPWVLVWLVWKKSSGSQIPSDIPVVCLNDFTHPNKIPGKDCPFAIDRERYYFTKQVHRDALRKRSKRKAGEQGAYWKSTSPDIAITDLNGKLIGYMRKYTLYEDKDGKRSANWYMEEYRVHDPHELVDQYVLCKIYDKDSFCPKYTETSIPALTKRIIERQQGSHPDQTNSLFDNRNQSQTQFDGSNSHEDIIMQPPSEKSPPESILPTSGPPSDNKVFPMLHGLSNEFSMSRDPSGNLNPPESIRPIPGPPNYSNGFSTSHDASGNQNRPEPIPSIPWNNNPMNQSQTQPDNNNFVEDHIMQPTFPTSEDFLSDSIWPMSPWDSYSNEYRYMMDGISNGPSMPHYLSGNLNAVDGKESSLDCFSQLWNH